MLRDYQLKAINKLYEWFESNSSGNPCLVLPTGSGKSHIVAYLCKDALQKWPQTRVLMLTHQQELISQNAEKMRQHWPNAPLGIYSASIGKRQVDAITFAGIQSVRGKATVLGHKDLIIIDECHLINNKAQGTYRKLIEDLTSINPNIRIIGLTASPWRLGQGKITDGDDTLFSDIIEPVSIEELIYHGFLSPLKSKQTKLQIDTSQVKKRGGEYIESELNKAVDSDDYNGPVVDEIVSRAGKRKSWLIFCSGVEHSEHIRDHLIARGITSETVTGKTPKREREHIIDRFKRGEITALTNANVLTTGFDAPNIDLIAMLRPTLSPVLYLQMAGRGMRLKEHTDHCLVLDFVGNVSEHGPITAIQPPTPSGSGNGEAPVKVCPECFEIVHTSKRSCPECGHEFPESPPKPMQLHNDDIMGIDAQELLVTGWKWQVHVGKTSNKEMLKVTYYGALSDQPITEYLCILHGGYAGNKAMTVLNAITESNGAVIPMQNDLDNACDILNESKPPTMIKYKKDGKFYRVLDREWHV